MPSFGQRRIRDANLRPGCTVLSVVKRRAYIVGMLVIGLLAATGRTAPVYCRVVSSAHRFQQSFRDLKQADTMSPIERFLFSLVLANSKAPKGEASNTELPFGRT